MANAFKNALLPSVGTTGSDVYTAGAGVTTTIIGMTVANRESSIINVDVELTDTSTSTTTFLVKGAPVPTNSSLVVVGGDQKVVLEESDTITVTSDTAASADATISILEQT